jgi:hypothetical protein
MLPKWWLDLTQKKGDRAHARDRLVSEVTTPQSSPDYGTQDMKSLR